MEPAISTNGNICTHPVENNNSFVKKPSVLTSCYRDIVEEAETKGLVVLRVMSWWSHKSKTIA